MERDWVSRLILSGVHRRVVLKLVRKRCRWHVVSLVADHRSVAVVASMVDDLHTALGLCFLHPLPSQAYYGRISGSIRRIHALSAPYLATEADMGWKLMLHVLLLDRRRTLVAEVRYGGPYLGLRTLLGLCGFMDGAQVWRTHAKIKKK